MMTKEEILAEINFSKSRDRDYASSIAIRIFDYFENQKCKNCKYYGEIWFRECTIAGCELLDLKVGRTFSCNKWEANDSK